jgi:hypothetical protein
MGAIHATGAGMTVKRERRSDRHRGGAVYNRISGSGCFYFVNPVKKVMFV